MTLKGEITLDVKLSPPSLSFGEILVNQKPAESFEIEVMEPEKVTVKSVRSEDERFSVEKVKSVDKAKSSWKVAFAGAAEPNHVYTRLIIELSGSDVPQIELPVRANVVGNLKYPSHIYLLQRSGEYQPRQITISSRIEGAKFAVKKATDPDGNMDIKIDKTNKNETQLTVSLKNPKIELESSLKGNILLKTTDPTEPELTIRYTVTAKHNAARAKRRMLENRQKGLSPSTLDRVKKSKLDRVNAQP